jgi:hypothetical protein
MFDPTRQEIDELLAPHIPQLEADEFDVECAIYWFAAHNHLGQDSNLYEVLSTSPYNPGAIENDATSSDAAYWLYTILLEARDNAKTQS